jgi:hypothetical protein
MKNTVILVGTNELTRHLIPWERTDADFWLFNECASLKDERHNYWAKRCDAVFQMHAPVFWRNRYNNNHPEIKGNAHTGHYYWLKQAHDIPIYMQEHYPDVPASVKYPFDEIIAEFLPSLRNEKGEQLSNFTSTVAYCLALALHLGYKRIELYGIEAQTGTEYVRQKPGIFFWLGIAAGRGVSVVIQSRSTLLAEKPYGYTGEIMIMRQEFENAYKQYQQLVKTAEVDMFESTGKVKTLFEQFCQTSSQSDANRIGKEMIDAMKVNQDKIYAYGELAGKMMENRRYLAECDKLIEAAGGKKAVVAIEQMQAESVPA